MFFLHKSIDSYLYFIVMKLIYVPGIFSVMFSEMYQLLEKTLHQSVVQNLLALKRESQKEFFSIHLTSRLRIKHTSYCFFVWTREKSGV